LSDTAQRHVWGDETQAASRFKNNEKQLTERTMDKNMLKRPGFSQTD